MEDRGFGLALGGGAARGLAHLGVLAALDEAGLSPGWLAGTSSGAIVAAFAAFGVTPTEAEAALGHFGWAAMTRPRLLGGIGVATNEGLGTLLTEVLGEVRLEDAPIPLAVVATDINTGERVVSTSGSLTEAVRASCCIPGLYAPVEVSGRQLVDGALVENVPAQTARELGAPVVMAVSLGFAPPFNPVRSWRQVMANAFDIAVNGQDREDVLSYADILVIPEVARYGAFRAPDRDALVSAGHAAGVRAVDELRSLVERAHVEELSWPERAVQSVRETAQRAAEIIRGEGEA